MKILFTNFRTELSSSSGDNETREKEGEFMQMRTMRESRIGRRLVRREKDEQGKGKGLSRRTTSTSLINFHHAQ